MNPQQQMNMFIVQQAILLMEVKYKQREVIGFTQAVAQVRSEVM